MDESSRAGYLTWFLSFFTLTFAFCILPSPAHAASRVECNAVKSAILKRAVRYCALLPASYDASRTRRFPVVYYLHGLGDEQTLVQTGGWSLVEDLQEQKRIGEFVIITPDGGRSFYINSHDGRLRYEDFFIREFLPAIEKRYRVQTARPGRAIGGTSMGGYGALRFAFKYPQLFSAVSAHSAALMEKLPQGAGHTPGLAGGSGGGILGDVFGTPLDPAFYERNSPLTLARSTPGLARMKIYFDCGRDDEYNFDAGAEKLNQTLTSRRITHEFHIYPGGHGWRFVAEHLDESLEFHSKAFGLNETTKR